MRIKVAELEGAKLDFWVAKAEGWEIDPDRPKEELQLRKRIFGENTPYIYMLAGVQKGDAIIHQYSPSSDWSQGGPIIERERICVSGPGPRGGPNPDRYWTAYIDTGSYAGGGYNGHGRTPLIAAMRCFVSSRFGEEIEE